MVVLKANYARREHMMKNYVEHINISVTDVDEAAAGYSARKRARRGSSSVVVISNT